MGNGSFQFAVAVDVVLQLIKKRLQLSYEGYWQPAFEDVENYRLVADVSLGSRVWKKLSLRISYLYTNERVVIEGVQVQEKDCMLLFGLSYQY